MDQYTPRVSARALLCTLLRDKYMAAAVAAGLTAADLQFVIDKGAEAKKADDEQREQIASVSAERSQRKAEKDALLAREDGLRDRLPAVIGDLRDAGELGHAVWLERLSFARYRFRELAPGVSSGAASATGPAVPAPASDSAEEEEVRRVTRVEREDVPTRAAGLAAFCRALVKPDRGPVAAAFAARGLSQAEIESIAAAAQAIADAGRNVRTSVEATKRETEAVGAQRRKWQQIKRMVRKAVAGVPELEAKYAEC